MPSMQRPGQSDKCIHDDTMNTHSFVGDEEIVHMDVSCIWQICNSLWII